MLKQLCKDKLQLSCLNGLELSIFENHLLELAIRYIKVRNMLRDLEIFEKMLKSVMYNFWNSIQFLTLHQLILLSIVDLR